MNKVAVVTGGQRGIGLSIARHLVDSGFRVAILSSEKADGPEVQDALAELGDGASYFLHDVTDIERVPDVLDQVEATLGPLTALVSNAGIAAPVRGDMLNVTAEHWDQVVDVNLRGAFFLAQAVARRMLTQQMGHYRSMTFVTSVSATMVSTERSEYCISKAGAAMMSQLFAARLAPHGIGVFELRPGIIATDMTTGVRDHYTPRIEDGLVPARRWGEPEDIGEIAVALATGQMKFATGAAIPVDGGLSIPRL